MLDLRKPCKSMVSPHKNNIINSSTEVELICGRSGRKRKKEGRKERGKKDALDTSKSLDVQKYCRMRIQIHK